MNSYIIGTENAGRVVDWLRAYAATHQGTFEDITPPMTQEIRTGVAAGADPGIRGASFGGVRSSALGQALRETRDARRERAKFRELARGHLRGAWVNPEFPHSNL